MITTAVAMELVVSLELTIYEPTTSFMITTAVAMELVVSLDGVGDNAKIARLISC